MKEALDGEDLHPYLMIEPTAFHCPDGADHKDGYHALPEFPYGKLCTCFRDQPVFDTLLSTSPFKVLTLLG